MFKQPTSYHCSIVKSVDIAGGPTKGRNVVLFFPDNNGVSLVVVGDARVDHLTLIKESVLQGGHPMIAYTVGLLSVASFVCPEGDATTSQEILRLQERSSDYLEWFKRTPVCQKLEKELRGNVPTTKVV